MTMFESETLKKILAYIAKNNLNAALEAEVNYMVVKSKINEAHLEGPGKDFKLEPSDKVQDKA